ncbi:aldose epimerase [Cellulomonas sp. H30R-01]|uniref:aldose epimerase family protein n=1 Tax=Cellulomonas sp. H30R-01 TaxID=2704467 RepID=UPI00138CA654|nr:aldose epimerase [Cellulomonas sp. H30R-01]QHT57761.1 aldose epimerase [Cellulomonas sp. H30R-01]
MTLLDAAPTEVQTDDPRVVTIADGTWEVDVLPGTGASLGAGRIRTSDGVWRDLLRPTSRGGRGVVEKCASFPMIPWSNRVRDGALTFRGRTHRLQRDCADGTAIHGAVRYARWDVLDRTPASVTVGIDTREHVGINFPWHFTSTITYAVRGGAFEVTTTLRNVDAEAFPGGFGHHPYFQRSLAPVGAVAPRPLGHPVVQVPAHACYPGVPMPTGPSGPLTPRADFLAPRVLDGAFIDDVYNARDTDKPITIRYEQPDVTVSLTADPVYEHLVFYAPRGRAYFAIEPATNVNDGVALFEAGVPGTGVFVLEPGEERTGTFAIAVTL